MIDWVGRLCDIWSCHICSSCHTWWDLSHQLTSHFINISKGSQTPHFSDLMLKWPISHQRMSHVTYKWVTSHVTNTNEWWVIGKVRLSWAFAGICLKTRQFVTRHSFINEWRVMSRIPAKVHKSRTFPVRCWSIQPSACHVWMSHELTSHFYMSCMNESRTNSPLLKYPTVSVFYMSCMNESRTDESHQKIPAKAHKSHTFPVQCWNIQWATCFTCHVWMSHELTSHIRKYQQKLIKAALFLSSAEISNSRRVWWWFKPFHLEFCDTRHVSFICVPWLVVCVCHDLFMCVSWLVVVCAWTRSYVCGNVLCVCVCVCVCVLW